MKKNTGQEGSTLQPIFDGLRDLEQANKDANRSPVVEQLPLQPPALYEDAGEGYNADYTFPQQ